jgi:ribose 5-phosphate isomerase A
MPQGAADDSLRALGQAAAALVEEGNRVGLGTGRAAAAFVQALGERVRGGLHVKGIPTSEATRRLAESLRIPLTKLEEIDGLDLTVDGADEVDSRLDLIKGLGGALIREKIVAATSKRFVVVVTEEKLVKRLGVRTPLPVEIVPFGRALCERRIRALGGEPRLRQAGDKPFVSDNGNQVLDCKFPAIDEPLALDGELRAIPGVVGTGLFVGMAERVLVEASGAVRVLER